MEADHLANFWPKTPLAVPGTGTGIAFRRLKVRVFGIVRITSEKRIASTQRTRAQVTILFDES
jgi:hypothetical protein